MGVNQNHNWTHSLTESRYVWDGVLLVSFVAVMLPHATTVAGHEWFSLLFLAVFAIHLLLHWHWILKAGDHLSDQANRWLLVLDCLLYLLMTFAIISGFLASEVMFRQLGFDFTPDPFWTKAHHQYSNLLFPVVGVHLAVHWRWIVNTTKRMLTRREAS